MVEARKNASKDKKLPNVVSMWLLGWGFLIGNAIGGLILMSNIYVWAIINLLALLTFFFLNWRYGEIIEAYIPRYKILRKEENDAK